MNIIFVEPAFPANQSEFVRALSDIGANAYSDTEYRNWSQTEIQRDRCLLAFKFAYCSTNTVYTFWLGLAPGSTDRKLYRRATLQEFFQGRNR